jgi:hypothetical protein
MGRREQRREAVGQGRRNQVSQERAANLVVKLAQVFLGEDQRPELLALLVEELLRDAGALGRFDRDPPPTDPMQPLLVEPTALAGRRRQRE